MKVYKCTNCNGLNGSPYCHKCKIDLDKGDYFQT